jgi:hypothetical protein
MQLKTYPEPGPEALLVRLRGGPLHRGRAARDRDPSAAGKPGGMRGLRPAGPEPRSALASALPVRAAVGNPGLLRLRDAPGRLCPLRRDGRARALGRRQESDHDELRLVPGGLGQAAVVDRGGAGVPHQLGQRVSGGHAGRRMGGWPSAAWRASRRSGWTRCSGCGATSTSRWSIRSTPIAGACSGSASSARPPPRAR